MRLKKSVYNTISLILQQIITFIYGLVVPSLLIKTFGSDVNGAIASITQFLSYITLLESGIGGVITSAMYKPLADNDVDKLSGIVGASEQFFKKLAYIFIIYLFGIAIIYPYIIRDNFDWMFTFTLVLIIGISTFAQYYFGITYQLLIQADQKLYVVSGLQIITIICTFLLTIICIMLHTSIHTLKLICAVVYVFRPLILNMYVKRKYKLRKDVHPDKEAISQRWDGLAHHIAYIIHYNTDVTVLTIFANVLEVSVYSVYHNIVSNVYSIISSVTLGIKASVGNMIAKGEKELLERTLNEFETLNFMLINIFYSCVLVLIIPFIKLYTAGVYDVNYIRPHFAFWLVLSEVAYGLRCPYDMIIFAAGHFKQTKKGAYVEAGINIIISLLLVKKIGIVGVAIGTFVAMVFRVVQYAFYLENNIMYRSIHIFLKKLLINVFLGGIVFFCFQFININIGTYGEWILFALFSFLIILAFNILMNYIFYRKDMVGIISHFYKVKKPIDECY